MKKDIAINEIGDLVVFTTTDEMGVELRDFSFVVNEDAIRQSINFRLKTKLKELFLHPTVGNELVEIIGLRNTRETAALGVTYIENAITRYNYIDKSQLTVEAIPISSNEIVYAVTVLENSNPIMTLALEVDLQEGIRRVV